MTLSRDFTAQNGYVLWSFDSDLGHSTIYAEHPNHDPA
jgi:hypothetical protein